MSRLFIDTGPLVALLNRRDQYNAWARAALGAITPPIFTCEAVVSEACFLLARVAGGPNALLTLVANGIVRVEFRLATDIEAVQHLMQRFASVPMSFADACLVRMTELEPKSTVLTLDRGFKVYRRNRRHMVPTLMPRLAF